MGKVYLVGAGPGDPELITLKGLKILKQADIVIYDRLVNEEILKYAENARELICVG
ncbi:MAG: SAM-dependent methyltransferase, partial [Nitrososphaerota archaeon]